MRSNILTNIRITDTRSWIQFTEDLLLFGFNHWWCILKLREEGRQIADTSWRPRVSPLKRQTNRAGVRVRTTRTWYPLSQGSVSIYQLVIYHSLIFFLQLIKTKSTLDPYSNPEQGCMPLWPWNCVDLVPHLWLSLSPLWCRPTRILLVHHLVVMWWRDGFIVLHCPTTTVWRFTWSGQQENRNND